MVICRHSVLSFSSAASPAIYGDFDGGFILENGGWRFCRITEKRLSLSTSSLFRRSTFNWPLFGGPFVEAPVDSEQLILKHGQMLRTLDFRRLTVTNTP
jgi:hypothetical protein